MKNYRLLLLFLVLFACKNNTKQLAEDSFNQLKGLEGEWVSDFDDGNFVSWENQDTLLVGTAYSTSDGDTILSELHALEILGDSLRYNVLLMNGSMPTEINYQLLESKQNQHRFISPEREFPKVITYELNEEEFYVHREGQLAGTEQEITETYLKRQE